MKNAENELISLDFNICYKTVLINHFCIGIKLDKQTNEMITLDKKSLKYVHKKTYTKQLTAMIIIVFKNWK